MKNVICFLLIVITASAYGFEDVKHNSSFMGNGEITGNIYSDGLMNITLSEVSPSGRTYYDLQSNGSAHMIEQDRFNPNKIHAVFMVSTDPGPSWSNRNARYFFTSDGGINWIFKGNVNAERSGFPVIALSSDGSAIVGNNTTVNGLASAVWAFDTSPGAGNFIPVQPPPINGNYPLSPNGIVSNNKLFFTVSLSSSYINVCLNLNPPGTFLGYHQENEMSNSILSAIGAGTGKIGLAYITGNTSSIPGAVKLTESTNEGVTWGAPIIIWLPNNIDSLAAFRGIDITDR